MCVRFGSWSRHIRPFGMEALGVLARLVHVLHPIRSVRRILGIDLAWNNARDF